jgi:circadian clock protein KaiC
MPATKNKRGQQRRISRGGSIALPSLAKAPTGIQGLDEVTGGGLPRGRPTLICGGPGCGKTTLAVEFLVRGAQLFQERGVLLSFEETADDLAQNVASMGFDLKRLVARRQLLIDHMRVDRSEIAEAGDFDLGGIFIRLAMAIDSIGAKRVVLDTLEALFGGFSNITILRAELRRLFDWLKEKQLTAIITGERGDNTLTRHGLEEYVSDCVILLDHRVVNQLTARRLRIVKYRGTGHGTDEYPFLIAQDGISVLPITSLGLRHTASSEAISTGVPDLDKALGARGFFRASTILVSGSAGTGKSTAAGQFVAAATRRRERCLFVALEQSQSEILRNMASVGVELSAAAANDLLRFYTSRPTAHGLESHLTILHKLVADYRPRIVVIDAITSLLAIGSITDVASMVTRLVDFLKMEQITLCMTALIEAGDKAEVSSINISSLIDAWLLLRNEEINGERVRTLSIVKVRGMAHSNKAQEFELSGQGIKFKREASPRRKE